MINQRNRNGLRRSRSARRGLDGISVDARRQTSPDTSPETIAPKRLDGVRHRLPSGMIQGDEAADRLHGMMGRQGGTEGEAMAIDRRHHELVLGEGRGGSTVLKTI